MAFGILKPRFGSATANELGSEEASVFDRASVGRAELAKTRLLRDEGRKEERDLVRSATVGGGTAKRGRACLTMYLNIAAQVLETARGTSKDMVVDQE